MDISRSNHRLNTPHSPAAWPLRRSRLWFLPRPWTRRLAKTRERLTVLLVRHRSMVIMLVLAVVLVMEMSEHLLTTLYGEQIHFLFDAAVYTLMLPFCAWFMLGLLETSMLERDRAALDNNRRAAFSQRLGDARTWEELTGAIVEFAHQTAPRAAATLFTYSEQSSRMEPAASCRAGTLTFNPPAALNPDSQPIGSLPQLLLQTNGQPQAEEYSDHLPPYRYDLPLTRSDQVIGVIKLEYEPGSTPSAREIRSLKNAAPVITLALEGAVLQQQALKQACASEVERQKVAQHLHDTLAQNISYLRLKLDQLTGENSIREIGMVLQELEHMRATAEEAYQQVRSTLDELNPASSTDLMAVLTGHAQSVSQRAGIELRTSQVGAPYSLPPSARQQILYIAREALHNVEKHARARRVHLQSLWLENELILKITDDGIGFNPLSVAPGEQHYGLWIMHNRAQELGGSLKILPAETQGTEITLWVPRHRMNYN